MPAGGDVETEALTGWGYEQLWRATETHREELLVRLPGEAGLRATEVANLRPADVRSFREGGGAFLAVREADGSREAYLPSALAHELRQYVGSQDVAPEESLVDVTPRRIQMIVAEVGERAAEQTGRVALSAVTPTRLRRLFARRLLAEGANPRVVTSVGGWSGIDGLLSDLPVPDRATIAGAIEGDDATDDRRLRGVLERLLAVGEALTRTESRETLETAVCEALVEGEVYTGAWIAERQQLRGRDRVVVRAQAGESPDRFAGLDEARGVERALAEGEVVVVTDESDPDGSTGGWGLQAAVPLVHGSTGYGILVARTPLRSAFDATERAALADLGRRVAFTITAFERRRAVQGDTVVRLAFQCPSRNAFFVDLSAALSCTLRLDGVVPAGEHAMLFYATVEGADPDDVLAHAHQFDAAVGVRSISEHDDGGLFEFAVEEASPALVLAEHGGTVVDLDVRDGIAQVAADVSPDVDVRTVNDNLTVAFPGTELLRKEELPRPEASGERLSAALDERLTAKQREVLQAALHAGYFDRPRRTSAEDLADAMDVSAPTLHHHLRTAQEKLLNVAFGRDPT